MGDIKSARQFYEAALRDLEKEISQSRRIRADYLDHLREYPGDILGAYRVIEGRLRERVARHTAEVIFGRDPMDMEE